jgi:hypothetical protein
VLFCRNRSDSDLPALRGHFNNMKFHLSIGSDWLAQNPLTEAALHEEVMQWKMLGIEMQLEQK